MIIHFMHLDNLTFLFNVWYMRANARKHIGGYAKILSEGAINIRLNAVFSAGRYAMTHMPGTIRKSSGGGFADNRKEMNTKERVYII